jgi:hypothetical protein
MNMKREGLNKGTGWSPSVVWFFRDQHTFDTKRGLASSHCAECIFDLRKLA